MRKYNKNNIWILRKEEIVSYVSQGLTYEDIGKIFGVSRQRAYEAIRYYFNGQIKVRKAELNRRKEDLKTKAIKLKLLSKRGQARRLGIEFDLTFDSLDWPTYCPILGTTLVYGGKNNTASFDRIDPKKGYIIGNVRIISMEANRMKSNLNIEILNRLVVYIRESENLLQGC